MFRSLFISIFLTFRAKFFILQSRFLPLYDVTFTSNSDFILLFMLLQLNCERDVIFREIKSLVTNDLAYSQNDFASLSN